MTYYEEIIGVFRKAYDEDPSEETLGDLTDFLTDSDANIAREAAEVLGALGEPAGVMAARYIKRVGKEGGPRYLGDLIILFKNLGEEGLEPLFSQLELPDLRDEGNVLEIIAELGAVARPGVPYLKTFKADLERGMTKFMKEFDAVISHLEHCDDT